jgi:hypothetical protein
LFAGETVESAAASTTTATTTATITATIILMTIATAPATSLAVAFAILTGIGAALTFVLGAGFDFVAVTTITAFVITFVVAVVITGLIVHHLHGVSQALAAADTAVGRLELAFPALLLDWHHAAAFLLLQDAVARHRRHHYAEVVFGVLQIVLVLDAISARLGVARVLCVLLINLSRSAPDLHLGTIAFEWAIAVIAVATTAAAGLAPAPPLTLHETILIFRIFAPIGRI